MRRVGGNRGTNARSACRKPDVAVYYSWGIRGLHPPPPADFPSIEVSLGLILQSRCLYNTSIFTVQYSKMGAGSSKGPEVAVEDNETTFFAQRSSPVSVRSHSSPSQSSPFLTGDPSLVLR
jgi:hypothetical protein